MSNRALIIIGNLLILFGLGTEALALDPQSPSYSLPESYIGTGGTVNSQSAHYSESSTAGDIGVGNSSSASYQAQAGFNTTNDPRLSMVVSSSSVSFGNLSTAAATTGTSTFKVLNYTASGYSVYTVGAPPSTGSYTLAGMSSTGTSAPGTEQYGINLKANTSPVTFGTDPVQVPSSSFSYGIASTNYNSANNFRYVNGEKIAQADQTSGETDYTISYIVNVSTTTAGGSYSGSQSLVVVGSY